MAVFLLLCSLPAHAAPSRVVSLSVCTDQLLLAVAKPEQLVALTRLAVNEEISAYAVEAKAFPVHGGRMEEILTLAPDLVVVDDWTPAVTQAMLAKLNLPVLKLPTLTSLEALPETLMQLAKTLGTEDKAREMLKDFVFPSPACGGGSGWGCLSSSQHSEDEGHPPLAPPASGRGKERVPPASGGGEERGTRGEGIDAGLQPDDRPLAAFYRPNGYSPGLNTAQHSVLQAAGWRNLSAELGMEGSESLDMEQFIYYRPTLWVQDVKPRMSFGLGDNLMAHPVLKHLAVPVQEIALKSWFCVTPRSLDTVKVLAGRRKTIPQRLKENNHEEIDDEQK